MKRFRAQQRPNSDNYRDSEQFASWMKSLDSLESSKSEERIYNAEELNSLRNAQSSDRKLMMQADEALRSASNKRKYRCLVNIVNCYWG